MHRKLNGDHSVFIAIYLTVLFCLSGGQGPLTLHRYDPVAGLTASDMTVFIRRSLHWRHNDLDGVSNHQPHGCLLNRLFRRRSKKTSKLRVTGLFVGNSPRPMNSPHKGPVTRKLLPFDDVILIKARVDARNIHCDLLMAVFVSLNTQFVKQFNRAIEYLNYEGRRLYGTEKTGTLVATSRLNVTNRYDSSQ